ncbi:hypothetical protein BH23PLA1_BH23PLA1_14810 [soil metagenome]
MPSPIFDQICGLTVTLSPQEKLLLIQEVTRQLLEEQSGVEKKPFRSFRGALAHLGPAPSAEDIDEMRREAFANFPREDI